MGRWPILRFGLGLLLLNGLAPGPSQGDFRPGPRTLPAPPQETAEVLGFMARGGPERPLWPEGFLDRVRTATEGHGGVLLVGRTDPIGPQALNRSLALQYAVEVAYQLAQELSVELWRFACVGAGEQRSEPPGVVAVPWSPSRPEESEPARLVVLEPTPRLPRAARFWAIWEHGPRAVLWGVEGPEGVRVWELPLRGEPVRLPFPAGTRRSALGATYASTGEEAVRVVAAGPLNDPLLVVEADDVSSWYARLTATAPAGYTDGVVWASGIPYGLEVTSGEGEVTVALFPEGNVAYLQATDSMGRIVVGPTSPLPDGSGEPPNLLAVLVWEGAGVDLDLHAWEGSRHTYPQDPDATFSSTAVPETALLFDGGPDSRASALAVWGDRDPSVEVRCYSDMGREGARALLFVAERPGDPFASRYRIVGPRQLSERPLETRWPVLPGGR